MAEIVYGEESLSHLAKELADTLRNDQFGGTLYIGYPILASVDGPLEIDALYVSKETSVVAFDLKHLTVSRAVETDVEDVRAAQDVMYAALSSRILENAQLVRNRQIKIPITIVSISTMETFTEPDGLIVCKTSDLEGMLLSLDSIGEEDYRNLNSVIERTATIRPRKRRSNIAKEGSRGAILKQIEREIANLDAWQKKAAIEFPNGPQRIRGLAGSGKTIVLALKASYLHLKFPEWRIALTFQTRSLYQQFNALVRRFSFELSKEEPNWDRLTIMHAWGSNYSKGIYSEIAQASGAPVRDFRFARSQFVMGSEFGGITAELLETFNGAKKPPQIYDAILIDEAQDFPQSFFEMVYHCTKPPKRIVYAYDELQNLSDYTMRSPEDLFGRKGNGHPNVRLENKEGEPKQDIILPVCYRNTPWALTVAHALGFGISRAAGLVQMFEEPSIWKEIGYDVVDGELGLGEEVGLRRADKATPPYFAQTLGAADAVQFQKFDTFDQEIDWVATEISKDLTERELEHDDILIVYCQARTIKTAASKIMRALQLKDILSHLVGVTETADAVFSEKSVAITSIFRAKGNEAPVVYVIGADLCFSGFNLGTLRNILFTAMTRSRAWVRVCGAGDEMTKLVGEYEKIRDDQYTLQFRYPTQKELAKLRTLHRDRSDSEISSIKSDLESMARLISMVREGELSIDAVPRELRKAIEASIK